MRSSCPQVNACIPLSGITPETDVTALSPAERSADQVGVLAALCSLLPQVRGYGRRDASR